MKRFSFFLPILLHQILFAAEIAPAILSTELLNPVSDVTSEQKAIRGIHLTAWVSGSKKYRAKLDHLLKTSVINSVIIDIKEYEGEVYLPGVKATEKIGAYTRAVPDMAEWVADLKKRGVYTVARIVVFKDNIFPRKTPSAAVKNPQGGVWQDRNNIAWIDPYSVEGWRYNTAIAVEAARMGFDEIQFDYIRFPTDGALSQMRFIKPYSKSQASEALVGFLKHARQALKPLGVKISIDVFGLTTSDNTGMGIGQLIRPMAEQVDYVCPMIYPSHYAPGEYGIAIPNDQPYKVVSYALRDAIKNLGPEARQKLRPYFQDFSLPRAGIRYRAKEVEAQIQAAADQGIFSWNLWNARASYTHEALRHPVIPKSSVVVSVGVSTQTDSSLPGTSVDISTTTK